MLRVENLTKDFGGLRAVDACSFEVPSNRIYGLIGPNGSGKSTVFNLITGFYQADEGEILINGQRVNGLAPHAIVQRGVARTFQLTRVFPQMTVMENLLLAPRKQRGEKLLFGLLKLPQVRHEERDHTTRARELLSLVGLDRLANEYAGNLSYGQQKLVELTRALMTDPQLILLDEPMAGVNPTLRQQIVTYIRELQCQGKGFLIVEHDMPVVMDLCEWVIVLDYGKVIAQGRPDEIVKDERVLDAYLGQ